MTRLSCVLTVPARATHNNQIVTGYALLQRAGIVDLAVRSAPNQMARFPAAAVVEATIDGKLVVAYDLLDGYNVDPAALERYRAGIDVYFKRSYDPRRHRPGDGVYPLGLNYPVTTRHSYFWRARDLWRRPVDRVEQFEDIPRRTTDPRVVFTVGAWDPDEARDQATAADREQINSMRAACIRLLRRELGERFFGGMIATPYARRAFPDLVLDQSRTTRRAFLRLLHQFDIGIATTGLHGSTGWKLAEYMAAARGIVTEPLRYQVPGDLEAGRNYLTFTDPEHCVAGVDTLLEDPDALYRMRIANYEYYHRFLRPDRLVLNSLLTALEVAAGSVHKEGLRSAQ